MIHKESETIEFKKSTAELKEAVISVAAMLNKHGRAEVYFGIADDGTVLGQTVGRKTIRDVTQAIVDNTEPKVSPKVEYRKIEGKDCIAVEAHGINSPLEVQAAIFAGTDKLTFLDIKSFKGNIFSLRQQAEVKCIQFPSTEVEKPFTSYHIYDGNLFEQVDRAVSFVKEV